MIRAGRDENHLDGRGQGEALCREDGAEGVHHPAIGDDHDAQPGFGRRRYREAPSVNDQRRADWHDDVRTWGALRRRRRRIGRRRHARGAPEAERVPQAVGLQVTFGDPFELQCAEPEVEVDVQSVEPIENGPRQRHAAARDQPARHEEQRENPPQDEAMIREDGACVGGRIARVPDHQGFAQLAMLAVAQGRCRDQPVQCEEGPRGEDGLQGLGAEDTIVTAVVGGVLKEAGRVEADVLQVQLVGAECHMAGRAIDGEQHLRLAHYQAEIIVQGGDIAFREGRGPKVIRGGPHEKGRVGFVKHEAEIHLRAQVLGLANIADARITGRISLANALGFVARSIVGNDDLKIIHRLREQAVERGPNGRRAIVDGHTYGQFFHDLPPNLPLESRPERALGSGRPARASSERPAARGHQRLSAPWIAMVPPGWKRALDSTDAPGKTD